MINYNHKNIIKSFYKFCLFYCLLICQQTSCFADNKNQHSLEAKELHNSQEWKQFVEKKELADLNYDLYRMNGPDIDDRVILAQDPRGYLVDKHNKMFCSTQIDKKCQINSPLYTYADMRGSLLLQNFYKNIDEIKLATEVMKNIINPFPSNIALEMHNASVNDREIPDNKAALAEVYASEARLGVVRNSFNSILLNRLPLDLLKGKSSVEEKKFSILSIMEQEAKDRFENLDWQKSIDTGEQELCLKELAKMKAFKIWMDYHKYKQNERIEVLLATMVAQQSHLQQLLIDKNAKNN